MNVSMEKTSRGIHFLLFYIFLDKTYKIDDPPYSHCSFFPLHPLYLLFQPPPPDMFIYNNASCANKLLARWTVSSCEAGSETSGMGEALKSTVCGSSLDPTQPLEGLGNKALPSGGLEGWAAACVTHPPRLIPSWLFPLITIWAYLNCTF